MKFNIQDSFNQKLPVDPDMDFTKRRQVMEACFSYAQTKIPSNPSLIHVSKEMLSNLGLTEEDAQSDWFKKIFSGSETLEGSKPYAMCYGGHQFGHWAGQLGDGRAINLAEVVHQDK